MFFFDMSHLGYGRDGVYSFGHLAESNPSMLSTTLKLNY